MAIPVLLLDGEVGRILGQPKPHVAEWRKTGNHDAFALSPILRWRSPAVRIE